MWLIDHQMNMKVSHQFGQFFVRLPLTKAAKIIHANSLQIEWESVINCPHPPAPSPTGEGEKTTDPPQPPLERGENISPFLRGVRGEQQLDYILGNPPFVGKQLQNIQQKNDMQNIFNNVKNAGVLDYVTAWYLKAAQFIQNTNIRCAFVSTNSISQGEQVGILWQEIYNNYKPD